ncbi:MAG: hypothetical protein IJ680_08235 [Paludibacteraceae bacterium]|nr:hypothetical protein [Paludibacteraceae bacterium]
MKRILIFLALIPCLCMGQLTNKRGQELYANELTASIGTPSFVGSTIMFVVDVIDAFGSALTDGTFDNTFHGQYTLQYMHRFKPWFAFGGKATYEGYGIRNYTDKSKTVRNGSSSIWFSTLMPTVRFSYVNRPVVTLYSGLDMGILFAGMQDIDDNRIFGVLPAGNITLMGIHVGRKVYGMGELNFGFDAYAKIGIGYRF